MKKAQTERKTKQRERQRRRTQSTSWTRRKTERKTKKNHKKTERKTNLLDTEFGDVSSGDTPRSRAVALFTLSTLASKMCLKR